VSTAIDPPGAPAPGVARAGWRTALAAVTPWAALRHRFRRWWEARLPLSDTLTLTQRNVYILPTASGWMLALTLLVLLVASINYQLNLGYLLTFLLAGSAVVGMHICHANLRGLTLHLNAPEPHFLGTAAAVEVQLASDRKSARYGVALSVHGDGSEAHHWAWTDIPAQGTSTVQIAFKPPRRGLHRIPTLTAETRFPLGTFRVWTYWRPAAQVLVYPAPESPAPPLPAGEPAPTGAATRSSWWSGRRPPSRSAPAPTIWSAATPSRPSATNCGWTCSRPACKTPRPAFPASPPGCCRPTGWVWTTVCVCRAPKSRPTPARPTGGVAWRPWRCSEQPWQPVLNENSLRPRCYHP